MEKQNEWLDLSNWVIYDFSILKERASEQLFNILNQTLIDWGSDIVPCAFVLNEGKHIEFCVEKFLSNWYEVFLLWIFSDREVRIYRNKAGVFKVFDFKNFNVIRIWENETLPSLKEVSFLTILDQNWDYFDVYLTENNEILEIEDCTVVNLSQEAIVLPNKSVILPSKVVDNNWEEKDFLITKDKVQFLKSL